MDNMNRKTVMTENEVVAGSYTVLQELEALRVKHTDLLNSLQTQNTPDVDYKTSLISKNINMIELGLQEAQVMVALASYLQKVETDNQKLLIKVRKLTQENLRLKKEVAGAQRKLRVRERAMDQLEEEKRQLEFMDSTIQYDRDIPVDDENAKDLDKDNPFIDFLTDVKADERNTISSAQPTQLIQQETVGHEIPARLRTLHNLVIQYASQNRYEVAVPLCKQALKDLEETLGHEHPFVATMLTILALVYRDQKKFKEAANLLIDALAIRKKTLGKNHPAVAGTLNTLAILYGKRGKYKKSESLFKRALEIREKVLGADHPDVAKQLSNLALLYRNQGNYDEVERYYKRALEIYEAKFGSDDSNVVRTKNNLASCYLKQGKYKDVEELYRQVPNRALDKNER